MSGMCSEKTTTHSFLLVLLTLLALLPAGALGAPSSGLIYAIERGSGQELSSVDISTGDVTLVTDNLQNPLWVARLDNGNLIVTERGGGGLLTEIDPVTGNEISSIAPGFQPNEVLVEGDTLWVTTFDGRLMKSDNGAAGSFSTIAGGMGDCFGPIRFNGDLYITNTGGKLFRIDGNTPIEIASGLGGALGLLEFDGAILVSDFGGNVRKVTIDPSGTATVQPFATSLNGASSLILSDDGGVIVSQQITPGRLAVLDAQGGVVQTFISNDLTNPRGMVGNASGAATPINVALTENGGIASQSSTINGNGNDGMPQIASRAIDGDTNGDWYSGKITHTANESMPWWEVQLGGGVNTISQINIWNRTDCCAVRLDNFDLTILNAGTVVWSALDQSHTLAAPEAVFPIPNVAGDTVRIQLRGFDYLSLAEVQVWASGSGPVDTDGDGIFDDSDNCPLNSNADQNDNDVDGVGDVCDDDDDNDSVLDGVDNCPLIANTDQANTDGMGAGDACNSDFDNDGWDDQFDACPNVFDPDQTDTDSDGEGDACDLNDDNDAFDDDVDNCPTLVNNDQSDSPDMDGIGDVCDADDDNDGAEDVADNCPITANSDQNDTDLDGLGDACDDDIDGDATLNNVDNCPFIFNAGQEDLDGDGIGDACNDADDTDGDEWLDALDNCPTVPNSGQADLDADGVGDVCDSDVDGDGTANADDQCANTSLSEAVDPANGCNIAQLCPCEGPRGTTTSWKNHGKYVSCVAHASNSFRKDGLISKSEKSDMTSEAAASSCGK